MAFDPTNFLAFSKDLEQLASTEAQHRTVLSRAYYAVFGFLRLNINRRFRTVLASIKK